MQKRIISILLSVCMCIFPTTVYATNVTKAVPVYSTFKTFMDYRTISNHHSPQWALEEVAYTDSNGLRKIGDRYLVAVGSYYTRNIGQAIDVTLNDGNTLKCIVGDAKDDKHTINNHSTGTHNDAIEFIVDQRNLYSIAKNRGDVSFVPGFAGAVSTISLVDTPIADEPPEVVEAVAETLDVLEQPLEAIETVDETPIEDIVTINVVTEDTITMNILDEFSEADTITEG